MIEILINQQNRKVAPTQTLELLLKQLDNLEENFAIAINQKLIPKSKYATTTLNSNDKVEIIVPQQGG